ncbi:38593_t:CDS:1, partial [Gigaspora margarita]
KLTKCLPQSEECLVKKDSGILVKGIISVALKFVLFPSYSDHSLSNLENHQSQNHGRCKNQQPRRHNEFGVHKDPSPLNFTI